MFRGIQIHVISDRIVEQHASLSTNRGSTCMDFELEAAVQFNRPKLGRASPIRADFCWSPSFSLARGRAVFPEAQDLFFP